jgi:hypothetical protein
MKIKDEIKAKHVMGELTLEDVWNLVSRDCGWIGLMKGDIDEAYIKFHFDGEELSLWYHMSGFDDPDWIFPGDTKVKVKEGYIEFDDPMAKLELPEMIKLTFAKVEPIRLEIL